VQLFLFSIGLRLFVSGAPTCQQGQTETRGPYWYQCVSGSMQPAGCVVVDTSQQVKLGDTYMQDGYEYQCFLDTDGRPWEKIVACWYNGQRMTQGEVNQNAKAWYQCVPDVNNGLRLQMEGCVADGHRLNVGEQYADAAQGVLFECRVESNGAMAICAVGCVINGQSYLIGQQYVDGYKVMICNAFGRVCRGMLVGCVDTASGKQYPAGTTFTQVDGQVVRCDVIANDIQLSLVGCTRDSSPDGSGQTKQLQVPLNAQWRQGTAPYLYQLVCQETADGKVTKVQNLCIYAAGNGAKEALINPGCYQRSPVDGTVNVGCQQMPDNTLQIVTFPADSSAATAQSYGLKQFC